MTLFYSKERTRILRHGTWLYAGEIEMQVYIAELEYDPCFELAKADGLLEDGDLANLNSEGKCYYLALPKESLRWPYSFVGIPKHTVQEITEYADEFFESGVTWKMRK